MNLKRRPNGKGSAIYLGEGRAKPWAARISLGRDKNGVTIKHTLGTFENKLDALFCLEQYNKDPRPIYIKTSKYNRISAFSSSLYPIVPVDDPKKLIELRENRNNYTFKQLYEEFAKLKFPTQDEITLERTKNIKPKNKFVFNYARKLIKGYEFSSKLHNMLYREITTSNFQSVLNDAIAYGYGNSFITTTLSLFKHLDNYALQKDIISKSYAQYATNPQPKSQKQIKTIFTPYEIQALKDLQPKTLAQQFIRDMFIFSLYTGCRASEIIFTRTENIFLDKNYLITGVKTKAGKNREIPIHPVVKEIVLRHFDKKNEFLFTYNNKCINYTVFGKYIRNFFKKHPELGKHTLHECRHTFRTELERLNIRYVTINAILGHKNNDVGLDVYTHIGLDDKLAAVRLVDYSKNPKLILFKTN